MAITKADCEVYVLCRNCGEWTFIQGEPKDYGNLTSKAKCADCGSSRLDPQSTISKRTYDPEIAKRKSSEARRLIKKQKNI